MRCAAPPPSGARSIPVTRSLPCAPTIALPARIGIPAARADGNHEFHFWLGVADWRLGEESAELRHLTLAIDNSVTRDQHDLYAAKLAWLQARRQH